MGTSTNAPGREGTTGVYLRGVAEPTRLACAGYSAIIVLPRAEGRALRVEGARVRQFCLVQRLYCLCGDYTQVRALRNFPDSHLLVRCCCSPRAPAASSHPTSACTCCFCTCSAVLCGARAAEGPRASSRSRRPGLSVVGVGAGPTAARGRSACRRALPLRTPPARPARRPELPCGVPQLRRRDPAPLALRVLVHDVDEPSPFLGMAARG